MGRSAVYGRACVASSQPLATSAGILSLRGGGNAADAAVAVAAALAVTEPCSNGVGGDMFALHYSASTRRVSAVHGNGALPSALPDAHVARDVDAATGHFGAQTPSAITVPGAVAGWHALKSAFGRPDVSLAAALAPAVALADRGFPVAPVTAAQWGEAAPLLRASSGGARAFLLDGGTRAPAAGELFRNRDLARTLRDIGERGAVDGFYRGRVADAVAACVRGLGGAMTAADMAAAGDEAGRVRPAICCPYGGGVVWEVGAPTHGGVALLALNVLEAAAAAGGGVAALAGGAGGVEYLHCVIEAVRLAYAEAGVAVGDAGDDGRFVSKAHARALAGGVAGGARCDVGDVGAGMRRGGTVQFCVVDEGGDAVSLVQSNYMGFGTGHAPDGCGFTLHNRGLGFTVGEAGHVNAPGAGRKPYHTIIPGMVTRPADGSLLAAFGCMGSYMQPQGHVQLVSGLLDFGLDAQAAVDAARLRVRGGFASAEGEAGDDVALEAGLRGAAAGLAARGHAVAGARESAAVFFGRAQVITRAAAGGVVCGGSDGRADGCAAVL